MRRCLFPVLFLVCCPLLAAQQAMNNDSVVKLVKAGLSEDLIISTINATPGTYDTSVDSLIALKTAGATDKVIGAVIAKNSVATSARSSGLTSRGLEPTDANDQSQHRSREDLTTRGRPQGGRPYLRTRALSSRPWAGLRPTLLRPSARREFRSHSLSTKPRPNFMWCRQTRNGKVLSTAPEGAQAGTHSAERQATVQRGAPHEGLKQAL